MNENVKTFEPGSRSALHKVKIVEHEIGDWGSGCPPALGAGSLDIGAFDSRISDQIVPWRNSVAQVSYKDKVSSSNLDGTTIYGLRDCMEWSPPLQGGKQLGSIPRRSTNETLA